MKYKKFVIHKYKGIKKDLEVRLDESNILALIGLNESGKSTILKAILAFDYNNDERYSDQQHLEELTNYYNIEEEPSLRVSAVVKLKENEAFKEMLYELIKNDKIYSEFGIEHDSLTNTERNLENIEEDDDDTEDVEESSDESEEILSKSDELYELFNKQYRSFISKDIVITRNYSEKNKDYIYSLNHPKFTELTEQTQNKVTKLILEYLPIINYLYSRSEIVSKIYFDDDKNKSAFWLGIYDNLFRKVKNKSVKEVLSNSNKAVRDTALSAIKEELNDMFFKTWNSLGVDKSFTDSLNFDLSPETDEDGKQYLYISLTEKLSKKGTYHSFDLKNRSDGFKWYFTFIMQFLYNPTIKTHNNKVLFLLDEPGLYLNPAAQKSLLERLTEITKENKNMQVVYTTHSHYMLYSEYISPYQIHITSKDSDDLIVLHNLKHYPSKGESKTSTLTPLFESLKIPFDERSIGSKRVILVEGIHDFYALTLFGGFDSNYYIYPCAGATTIINNVAMFITLGAEYVFLVDNDHEGVEKALNKINERYQPNKGIFLPFEGYKSLSEDGTFPDNKYEMDDIFSDVIEDWSTNLDTAANYKRIIEYMYFKRNTVKVKKLLRTESILDKFKIVREKLLELF